MNQSTTVLKDIPLEFDKFDNNLGISWQKSDSEVGFFKPIS